MTAIAASPILRPEREPRSTRFWIAVVVSVVLHVLVLGAWLFLGRGEARKVPPPATMEVTIADDVGLTAGAPNTTVDPAQSRAPVVDTPEESAPPPPASEPERAEPTPPRPQPKAAPAPKPAPVAKTQPKVVTAAPATKPLKVTTKPVTTAQARPALTPGKGAGTTGTSTRRPPGLNFGKDYFKGATDQPSQGTSTTPKTAVMTAQASMDIGRKILQQVQPCANRQVKPGPGAERIRVTVRLKINRDGTLAARPTIEGVTGTDDENSRYEQRVKDAAIATFMGCQPLRGLPPEYYAIPNGWSNFQLRYKLPG